MGKRIKVTFDDVRAVLYDPPSMASWRRLWSLLSKVEPELLQSEVLPYVRELLRRWPGGMRPLPKVAWPLLWGTEEERADVDLVVRMLAPLADSLLLRSAKPAAVQVAAMAHNPLCKNLVRLELQIGMRAGVGPEEGVRALAASSMLDGLRFFEWRGMLPEKEGQALLEADWFRNLEVLTLATQSFVCSSKPMAMTSLEELTVNNGSPLANLVLEPGALPKLRKVSSIGVVAHSDDSFVEMLNNATGLETLWYNVPSRSAEREVSDGTNRVDSITRDVLSSPILRERLKHLRLHNVYVEGVADVLTGGGCFERLESFGLKSGWLMQEDVLKVVGNTVMPSLQALSMRSIPMSLPAVEALVNGPLASGLKTLALINVKMRPESLKALVQADTLAGLEHLDITSTSKPLLAKTLKVLLEPHKLHSLRTLVINGPNVTDELVFAVESNPFFASLETLSIFPCAVSVQGIYRRLTALPWSKRLEASQHLFGTMKQDALLKVFKGIKESVPSTERLKALLVERAALLAMDDVRLATMLSCEATLKTLDKRVLKATARGLKLKGYTKLTQAQLVAQLSEALNSEDRGLLATCRSERVGVS